MTRPGTDHLNETQLAQLDAAEAIFADPQIELDPETVAARLATGSVQLVDVRRDVRARGWSHRGGATHRD